MAVRGVEGRVERSGAYPFDDESIERIGRDVKPRLMTLIAEDGRAAPAN